VIFFECVNETVTKLPFFSATLAKSSSRLWGQRSYMGFSFRVCKYRQVTNWERCKCALRKSRK